MSVINWLKTFSSFGRGTNYLILKQQEEIMATITDVQSSVAEISTTVADAVAAIQAETTKVAELTTQLTAAIANEVDPNVLQDIVNNIVAANNSLKAAIPTA